MSGEPAAQQLKPMAPLKQLGTDEPGPDDAEAVQNDSNSPSAEAKKPDQKKEWSADTLNQIALKLLKDLDVKDRTLRFRLYPKCFVGLEACEFMVASAIAETIDEAVTIGNLLLAQNLFQHVTNEHNFKADKIFYRFARDAGAVKKNAGSQGGARSSVDKEKEDNKELSALLTKAKAAQARDAAREEFDRRTEELEKNIQSDKIDDRNIIRPFALSYGVPEKAGVRALVWKILLKYLPNDRTAWATELGKKRTQYNQWVLELIVNPYKRMENDQVGAGQRKSVAKGDDPLSNTSDWKEYYKDQELRHEIEKDVKRTYSSFHFFNQPVREDEAAALGAQLRKQSQVANTKSQSKDKDAEPPSLFDPKTPKPKPGYSVPAPRTKENESHHDVLQRILFIYAKLNPGISYVQGMNEVLAPIYFIFAKDSDVAFRTYAEADAFYCFTNVMSEIRDRFIKSLDLAPSGIIAVVREVNDILQQLDFQLWQHLENNGVDPRFYSFRWLTLLLSQEFELPDVLRLWDALFADPKRFHLLNCTCAAMLICIRSQLLQGDFAANLALLQKYPSMDINIILQTAQQLATQTKTGISVALRPSIFFEGSSNQAPEPRKAEEEDDNVALDPFRPSQPRSIPGSARKESADFKSGARASPARPTPISTSLGSKSPRMAPSSAPGGEQPNSANAKLKAAGQSILNFFKGTKS